jgi:A/G-specific adenine glycosylase
MKRFPTIQALADASLDEVIKEWEGLGYYSRARHLHAGAQFVVSHFNGVLPSSWDQLQQIKGLGPYTIGAILSFAFHQRVPAVDGNVLRVLSRYFHIEEDITKSAVVKQIRHQAQALLPEQDSWVVNEALIELGATVCQKKAKCPTCPVRAGCQAHLRGTTDQLPIKSKGVKTEYLYRTVFVIECEGHYLVKKGKKGEIMSDLHEFPYLETSEQKLSNEELLLALKRNLGVEASLVEELENVSHSFTRYQAYLRPVLLHTKHRCAVEGFSWKSMNELKNLAFSSGHRRVWLQCIVD